MANMADDAVGVDGDVAEGEPDQDESEAAVHLADVDDEAAYALASIGLDQLLNFC